MRRDLQSELKKLHECNPEVGVVHNGKTALEWCELYFAATAELEALKKMERDRWTGWAKELGWTPATRMIVCQKCGNKRCPRAGDEKYKCTGSNATGQIGEMEAADEPRSFDESYLAIRAAGGDAWDGLDVAKKLAEIRGHEAADDEADGSQQ